jgi:hypothetical protein
MEPFQKSFVYVPICSQEAISVATKDHRRPPRPRHRPLPWPPSQLTLSPMPLAALPAIVVAYAPWPASQTCPLPAVCHIRFLDQGTAMASTKMKAEHSSEYPLPITPLLFKTVFSWIIEFILLLLQSHQIGLTVPLYR